MKKTLLSLLTLLTFQINAEITLDQLSAPPGFRIDFFAKDVKNARQLALSKSGLVFAGSRRAGNVYAFLDTDKDGKADKRWLIAKGLELPSGIAWKDGDLYVAEVSQILRFPDIDNNLDNPKSEVYLSGLPKDRHHGWKFLRFSPQGDLVFPIGAPCNTCKITTDKHARIFSINKKTKALTELAKGVRNSVGFDFHPDTGELWFSDNGSDMMGDDIPADEINRVTKTGSHFGYPYFHQGNIRDPEFGVDKNEKDYVHPVLNVGAHVATLGIHFYQGSMFPASYNKQLFVAEHGSWNRSKKSGYKIGIITMKGSDIVKYEPFITGFMQNEKTYGRPVALLELDDGSLLISDDHANNIYRVSYEN
ncbi:MAG: sorbosone dehydrogenase [Gammaproteobacteria bacterium]|nr:MAG: sorbosone dehydrogenase [Gammaproteobacteria bacterium]